MNKALLVLRPAGLAGKRTGFWRKPDIVVLALLALLALSAVAANRTPNQTSPLTIINKSGKQIAVQLKARSQPCVNNCDTQTGFFYYLVVPKGDREQPATKTFDIEQDTYSMQLYYLESYDPVYGYDCNTAKANAMFIRRSVRLTVLPCTLTPSNVGEPGMRKYLPNSVRNRAIFDVYWLKRLIY